jgi:hypothetical protein
MVTNRVARWYIFKPKIPIWVNFEMRDVGKYYVRLVNFTAISHILGTFCGHFGIFFQVWCV